MTENVPPPPDASGDPAEIPATATGNPVQLAAATPPPSASVAVAPPVVASAGSACPPAGPVDAASREAAILAGLHVICICRGIRRKTIEQAIRNGARSLSEVRRKTGATTGPCGATRCTGPIQGLLAAAGVSPGEMAAPGPGGPGHRPPFRPGPKPRR